MSENRPRTRRWISSQSNENEGMVSQSASPYQRSKSKSKSKLKTKYKSKSKAKFSDYPMKSEITAGDMGDTCDRSSILKHMEALQKNTEIAMTAAIKQAVDSSKCEINKNMNGLISTLTTSIDEVKRELSEMEDTFSNRLENVETDLMNINHKVQNSVADIGRIEQAAKSDINQVKSKIKGIEGETTTLKCNIDKELIKLRAEMAKQHDEQRALLDKQNAELDSWKKQQERELNTIRTRSYGNENQIRQNTSQLDGIDSKLRAENVVIEGILEKEDESNIQMDIVNLVQKSLPDFKRANIKAVMRLGKPRKNKKKLRPIMVTLDNQVTRELILTHSTTIKTNSGNKFLWINRDQSDNSKRRHSLVKACYKLLLKHGYACSMRGSVITYQKKQYTYDTLNLLPEACTPFNVKSRETTDAKGLCFYSEHTYCSNFCL